MEEELRCSICGKLALEDSHFYKRKMLCNKHYIQMYRHGKILSEEEILHRNVKHECDICGDVSSSRYTVWSGDDEYHSKVLCLKHYAQLRANNEIVDATPSIHTKFEERMCDICGSNHHVIYHKGKCYCLRHYSQIKKMGGLMDITRFDKNKYTINEDGVYITLRNGKNQDVAETIIDEEDLERVMQHKWNLGTWGYASTIIDGKNVLMQRFILKEYDKYKIPDHINRNTLDNRRNNLRIVDKSMNSINSGLRSNNQSGVTGVSWSVSLSLWRAYINYKGRRIELGYFSDKINAIIARLNAENKYYLGCQPQTHLFEQYGIALQNDCEELA